MKKILMSKYGFVRWPEQDFSDDGSRFTCYKAGQRIRVSKTTYDGEVFISGTIIDGELPYEVYSALPHYCSLMNLNGISISSLEDSDLEKFYDDCLEYEQEYIDAENQVISELKEIGKPFIVIMNSTHPMLPETERLSEKLSTEYLEAHYKLVDLTFTDHIEPFLYNDKIIDLKTKMEEKYNWSGEIMFDDDYMESVMKSIKDVDDFLDDIEELEKLELSQVEDFINTPSGEEIEDAFKNLILLEEESEQDSISRYIVNRTDITRKLVNVYFNFEEFEYLFKETGR